MDDIDSLEREVAALEAKSGTDFEREIADIEAKRADLQRRKTEAEAVIAQQGIVDERKARAMRLKTILSERAELLKRLDETIDLLGELFRAEKVSRADCWQLSRGARTDLRQMVGSDLDVLNAVTARLAEYGLNPDRRFDKSKPNMKVATLAKVHEVLIQSMTE